MRSSMALSWKPDTRPHFWHTICMRTVLPVISSYSVAVRPRCRSVACKICAETKSDSVLYTVPVDIRSARQAFASWSAVKGCGSRHICSSTISRTGDTRIFRSLMYAFNRSRASLYVFVRFKYSNRFYIRAVSLVLSMVELREEREYLGVGFQHVGRFQFADSVSVDDRNLVLQE